MGESHSLTSWLGIGIIEPKDAIYGGETRPNPSLCHQSRCIIANDTRRRYFFASPVRVLIPLYLILMIAWFWVWGWDTLWLILVDFEHYFWVGCYDLSPLSCVLLAMFLLVFILGCLNKLWVLLRWNDWIIMMSIVTWCFLRSFEMYFIEISVCLTRIDWNSLLTLYFWAPWIMIT